MNREKFQPNQPERAAMHQSNIQQSHHDFECRPGQYQLAEPARQLGLATVRVLDEDQGRSGSGAVLALEASRLAQNNRDWHPLVDWCAVAQTLVMDHGGTFDLRLLNDRRLLGRKWTMSEFELTLRQQAKEAFLAKAKREMVLRRAPGDRYAPAIRPPQYPSGRSTLRVARRCVGQKRPPGASRLCPACADCAMRFLCRVIQTSQQRKHTMNRPSQQTELPLASETVKSALPQEVLAQCRQLIAQLLRQVLLAEKKEAQHEH